jgi:hypothetical protein
MSYVYTLEARISTLRRQLAAAEKELELTLAHDRAEAHTAAGLSTRYYGAADWPRLSSVFEVAPQPVVPAPVVAPPAPVVAQPQEQYVYIRPDHVIRIAAPPVAFKEARWSIPIPEDGIIKPHHSSDFFWPATRARHLVKAVNPKIKRQSFDKNIRYLAERTLMTPEQLIKTNPIVIGRQLGVSDAVMSQIFGDWSKLRQGYSCRAGAF